MILRKAVKDPADRARFGQHAPDLGADAIEIEVRARVQTHDDGAAVELGCGQCLVLHKNAIERQVQSGTSAIAWFVRPLSLTNNANCGSTRKAGQHSSTKRE